MHLRIYRYALVLVLSWIGLCSQVVASDLYQATLTIPVAGAANRATIVQQAFEQVLIKVAGNREIITDPAIMKQFGSADKMVSEFQYVDSELDTSTRQLQVRFDPAQIQDVLLQAEQEFWAGKRPTMMIWLVDNAMDSEQIFSSDSDLVLTKRLTHIATERGIPLTLPLMDLEDLGKISANELRQLDLEAINQASTRYGAPVQLVGKIQQRSIVSDEDAPEATETIIDWYLVQDYSRRHFTTQGENLLAAINDGLETGIDTIARRNAHVVGDAGQAVPLTLTVSDVGNIDSYADLLKYLQKISVVKHVDVKHIGHTNVTFKMSVAGGRAALVKLLAGDRMLAPASEGGALDGQNLRYQMLS